MTVKASDQNGNSATITVEISLTDVDEPPERPAAPVVSTDSDMSLSVGWTPPDNPGPPITDYDLQYRRLGTGEHCADWCAWQHNGPGTSNTITGLESGKQYQVQVLARNDEGASSWSPSGTGRTNVTGNDPPVFTGPTPDLSFKESIGNQPKQVTDVGQPVTADDPGDTLAYSLEGTDAGLFTIASSTGQIKTRSRVYDYEAEDPDYSYSVAVKATDSHGISDTIALTIRVMNESEPPFAPAAPSVSGRSTQSLSVSWNPPNDNRGRPTITSYDLQYRQGTSGSWTDDSQILSGTSRSATIPDPNST